MLNYTSADGYFDITEEKSENTIKVTYLFSTPIFEIENFTTTSTYDLNGDLIRYENDLGSVIDHSDNPIKALTPPRLHKGHNNE